MTATVYPAVGYEDSHDVLIAPRPSKKPKVWHEEEDREQDDRAARRACEVISVLSRVSGRALKTSRGRAYMHGTDGSRRWVPISQLRLDGGGGPSFSAPPTVADEQDGTWAPAPAPGAGPAPGRARSPSPMMGGGGGASPPAPAARLRPLRASCGGAGGSLRTALAINATIVVLAAMVVALLCVTTGTGVGAIGRLPWSVAPQKQVMTSTAQALARRGAAWIHAFFAGARLHVPVERARVAWDGLWRVVHDRMSAGVDAAWARLFARSG